MKRTSKLVRYVSLYFVVVGAILVVSGTSNSFAEVIVPEGFVAEVFAVNLGPIEGFTFDETDVLWVGSGFTGTVTRIEFNETTSLPIDGSILSPAIVGLDAVFGLAFDKEENLFLSEFCSGKVARIDASLLEGPFPIDASLIPPLTSGLGCPDDAAFAPPGSPFGTNLFVGDVQKGGILEIDPETGGVIDFTSFFTDIEGGIFSNDGQTMFAISPGEGTVYAMQQGMSPAVLASGFAFPDAIAQGPGNEFGADLYVGDLTGNTLFRVNPITGERTIFGDLGYEFEGFEDIIFDQSGRMYILGFGRDGQIVRISPIIQIDIDIKPSSVPNSINLGNNGVIPVAILGSESFDVTLVDASTVVFGPAGANMAHNNAHLKDVNDDGYIDMVLHFRTQETGIQPEDTIACLTGELFDGRRIEGCDSIRIVPPREEKIATEQALPEEFILSQNYPNPFNPFTNLSFTLPEAAVYSLKIYNVAGQLVRSYEGSGSVGLNVITWDAKDNTGIEVASGIYFYKLTACSFSATKKMIMMK